MKVGDAVTHVRRGGRYIVVNIDELVIQVRNTADAQWIAFFLATDLRMLS